MSDGLRYLKEQLWPWLEGLARFPLDPDQRLFWPYLVGAVVLALVVIARRPEANRRAGGRAWLATLFHPRVWWHPSARLDYQILLLNPLVVGLLGVTGLVSVTGLTIAISDWLDDWLGPAQLQWPAWAVAASFTLALFLADDCSRYLLHRLLHRVPALWALHKLHHSAQVLTPATVYRIHPLESALYALRMALTQGLVVGVFFYGFGMRLGAWDIAGANLFTFLFNIAGSNLRHSHVRLSYGHWLERIFISPAQHQVHHSNRPEHYDRNFGSFLAVWDWASGTLVLAADARRHGFGLGRGRSRETHGSLAQAYLRPLSECLGCLGGHRLAGWCRRLSGPRALPPTSS